MEEYKTKRIHYVEVAKDNHAAIVLFDGLDITDAGTSTIAQGWDGAW